MTVAVRGVPGIKAASFTKMDSRVEILEGKPEKVSEYSKPGVGMKKEDMVFRTDEEF
jgi:hypothetical protein